MIIATCRTCHKDWTLEKLPSAMLFNPSEMIVLEAPCGHGRYVGVLAFPPRFSSLRSLIEAVDSAVEAVEEGFDWKWQSREFDEARAAVEKWCQKHPQPRREPWNPPALVMTCVCGTAVTLVGEEDLEEGGEGWAGYCAGCQLHFTVWDTEEKQPYTQAREEAYQRAYRKWLRDYPRYPDALVVTSLQEKEHKGS